MTEELTKSEILSLVRSFIVGGKYRFSSTDPLTWLYIFVPMCEWSIDIKYHSGWFQSCVGADENKNPIFGDPEKDDARTGYTVEIANYGVVDEDGKERYFKELGNAVAHAIRLFHDLLEEELEGGKESDAGDNAEKE